MVYLSRRERQILRLSRQVAASVGEPLLQSTDEDALDARIDAGLEDPSVDEAYGRLAQFVAIDDLREASRVRGLPRRFVDILGDENKELLQEGDRTMAAVADAICQIRDQLAKNPTVRACPRESLAPVHRLAFLGAPGVPSAVARLLLGSTRADACLWAMLQAVTLRRRPESWLSRALVTRWVDGMRGLLLLLASVPEIRVAESLVPSGARLNVVELEETARAVERRYAEVLGRTPGSHPIENEPAR